VLAGDLLLVAHARQRGLVLARRQPADAPPCEHVVDPVIADQEAVVAGAQVPGSARRPEVVRKSLVDDLLLGRLLLG
jgi:hypothetical protein